MDFLGSAGHIPVDDLGTRVLGFFLLFLGALIHVHFEMTSILDILHIKT